MDAHHVKADVFARRTQWPLGQNAVSRALSDRRQQGKEILDLTVSNPTRCGFPLPVDDIQSALRHPSNATYTPAPRGLPEAREDLSRYYTKKNSTVLPEQVFLTASTSEAYAFLFRLLVNPGESVLFPRPSYPLFDFLGGLNDVDVQYYSLRAGRAWQPDLEQFRSLLNDRVKAVVLVNPNNPTGSYVRREDVGVMARLCAARGVPLISDEVFFDYHLDPETEPFTLLGYRDHLTFVLGGLSKALALPQMKLSWIVLNGPVADRERAAERLEVIADTYLSVATPAQHALGRWLTLQPTIHHMIMRRVTANDQALREMFSRDWPVRCLRTEGGWSAVLRLPEHYREETFVLDLLKEEGVVVYPGYFFDFEQEPLIVFSLLPAEPLFREAMTRVLRRLEVTGW